MIYQLDRSCDKWSITKSQDGEEYPTNNKKKANRISHILPRNCLLEKTNGKIEVKGRQGRRRKQLLGDLKEKRGYWKLKEEGLETFLGEVTLEKAMDLS
jgi:hypothetical protein